MSENDKPKTLPNKCCMEYAIGVREEYAKRLLSECVKELREIREHGRTMFQTIDVISYLEARIK